MARLKSNTVIAVIVFERSIGVNTDNIDGMIKLKNMKNIKDTLIFDNL